LQILTWHLSHQRAASLFAPFNAPQEWYVMMGSWKDHSCFWNTGAVHDDAMVSRSDKVAALLGVVAVDVLVDLEEGVSLAGEVLWALLLGELFVRLDGFSLLVLWLSLVGRVSGASLLALSSTGGELMSGCCSQVMGKLIPRSANELCGRCPCLMVKLILRSAIGLCYCPGTSASAMVVNETDRGQAGGWAAMNACPRYMVVERRKMIMFAAAYGGDISSTLADTAQELRLYRSQIFLGSAKGRCSRHALCTLSRTVSLPGRYDEK
jgi:hypothetical protein